MSARVRLSERTFAWLNRNLCLNMLRHTQGLVALLLQVLMLIPSGLGWAQAPGQGPRCRAGEQVAAEGFPQRLTFTIGSAIRLFRARRSVLE
jgi:hypothetical protein